VPRVLPGRLEQPAALVRLARKERTVHKAWPEHLDRQAVREQLELLEPRVMPGATVSTEGMVPTVPRVHPVSKALQDLPEETALRDRQAAKAPRARLALQELQVLLGQLEPLVLQEAQVHRELLALKVTGEIKGLLELQEPEAMMVRKAGLATADLKGTKETAAALVPLGRLELMAETGSMELRVNRASLEQQDRPALREQPAKAVLRVRQVRQELQVGMEPMALLVLLVLLARREQRAIRALKDRLEETVLLARLVLLERTV